MYPAAVHDVLGAAVGREKRKGVVMTSKGLIYFVIPVVCSIILSGFVVASERQFPPGFLDAARHEAVLMIETSGDNLVEYGFIEPTDRVENLKLGTPYPIYHLERDDLLQLDGSDFKKFLILHHWAVPVFFGENPRFLIFLRSIEGGWKYASAGGDPKPMLEAMERWKRSEGWEHSRVGTPWGLDFIMLEREENTYLYSFRDRNARLLSIERDEKGRYPLLEIQYVISRIKEHGRLSPEKSKHE